MRAVNLIPPEEQGVGSSRGPLRTGPAGYIIVGALALGLVLVIAMAVTSKQIKDGKADIAQLEQDLTAATDRANSLRAFSDFRSVQEARTQTVSSLAQSRFDWERVMRELSLVIPSDVWLLKMSGSVAPGVSAGDSGDVQLRSTIPGPALSIVGCAPSQDAVAGFVAALEDIDGVTRVGVGSSARNEGEAAEAPAAPTGGAADQGPTEDCRTESFIYQFEIAVAFDAVPAPPTATAPPAVPPAAPTTSASGQIAETAPSSTGSVAEQTGEAQEATNMVPGAGG